MGRLRTLVANAKVDRAARAHSCQANSRHRLQKGDVRLKVRNGRSWDHYCADCAAKIIASDIKKLQALEAMEPDE